MTTFHHSPAQCAAKVSFPSKRAARTAAGAAQAKGSVKNRLWPFRCEHGDEAHWHLGHKPPEAAKHRVIACSTCGRPWRPRVRYDRDGSVLWQRDADASKCVACQPAPTDDGVVSLSQQAAS